MPDIIADLDTGEHHVAVLGRLETSEIPPKGLSESLSSLPPRLWGVQHAVKAEPPAVMGVSFAAAELKLSCVQESN